MENWEEIFLIYSTLHTVQYIKFCLDQELCHMGKVFLSYEERRECLEM